MKLKFELGIRENERLVREELRIEDLSKRIQEQNEYVGPTTLSDTAAKVVLFVSNTH